MNVAEVALSHTIHFTGRGPRPETPREMLAVPRWRRQDPVLFQAGDELVAVFDDGTWFGRIQAHERRGGVSILTVAWATPAPNNQEDTLHGT